MIFNPQELCYEDKDNLLIIVASHFFKEISYQLDQMGFRIMEHYYDGLNLFSESHICYSQEGEDMILNRFLNGKKNGIYVDVGAHHPICFSNTYFFYNKVGQE